MPLIGSLSLNQLFKIIKKGASCPGHELASWELGFSMGRAKHSSCMLRNFLLANLIQIGNGDPEPEPDQECGPYDWIVSGYVYECAWAISNSTQSEHVRSDLEVVKILNTWETGTSESLNKVHYQDGQPITIVNPLHWDIINPLRSCNTVWSKILGWGILYRSTRRHQERMNAQQCFYDRHYKLDENYARKHHTLTYRFSFGDEYNGRMEEWNIKANHPYLS
jgi:hypothetical protein